MFASKCCPSPMMRNLLPYLLVLSFGFSFGTAYATPIDKTLRYRVLQIIQAPEYKPAPKIWKNLGIGPVNNLLAELALDAKSVAVLRRRATLALAEFPTSRTEATLRALIGDDLVPMGVRRQAMMSLSNAFPTKSLDTLQPRMLTGHIHLREAAILATIPMRDRRVEPLLQDRLEREKEIVVRTAVERAIKERRIRRERAERKKKQPVLTPLRPDQRDGL